MILDDVQKESPAQTPTIEELLRDHYAPNRLTGKSSETEVTYYSAVRGWNRFRRDSPIAKIDTKTIVEFQRFCLSRECAPATVNSYCRHIMAMLRFAAEEEIALIAKPPKWKKIKEPKLLPLALTVEEFAKVLEAAKRWSGEICGYPAGVWWMALLLVAWETGLRYTALLTLRSVDVLWDSCGLICQADKQKDKEAMWFTLPPHVMDAVRQIYEPRRKLLFPRDVRIEAVGKWFRRLLDDSGIYAPKGSGMRFHRIRKSKASYTEALGGDAQKALGHSARSVTERYLDPRIVGAVKQPFMPPPVNIATGRPLP